MQEDQQSKELMLNEEEAGILLDMCLTSPSRMVPLAQQALRKLAEFCASFEGEGTSEIIRIEAKGEASEV